MHIQKPRCASDDKLAQAHANHPPNASMARPQFSFSVHRPPAGRASRRRDKQEPGGGARNSLSLSRVRIAPRLELGGVGPGASEDVKRPRLSSAIDSQNPPRTPPLDVLPSPFPDTRFPAVRASPPPLLPSRPSGQVCPLPASKSRRRARQEP